MENMFKNAANTNKNDSSSKLRDQVSSGRYWGMRTEREQVGRENCEGLILEGLPTLQEFNETPVFVGGDVEALYPSMEHIPTARIMYQEMLETRVEFNNLDFKFMNVYLFLVLGREELKRHGLKKMPVRLNSESEGKSLLSKANRNMNNWSDDDMVFSLEERKIMLALTVQINTLLLMSTSCYTFGGKIYQQRAGSGIGLRGSACSAKVLMGHWDKKWCRMQVKMGLVA